MNIRRITTMMMAMAMAVGGVLSVATPAIALPSTFGALVPSTFVDVYGSGTIPLSGVVSVTAPCPTGMAAVSAGGLADGLYSITPGPGYDSGMVSARAVNGNTGSAISASATCAPTAQFAGTSVAKREQHAHSTTGEWTATVTCPAGMRAFGGGGHFRASDGTYSKDEFFLSANAPTLNGRGWTVSAMDNTFTDTLVVDTRCAIQSSSTRLVEEIYPVVPVVPGTTTGGRAQGYAHCPAGFLPISGGAQFTQDGAQSAAQAQLSVSVTVRQIGWYANGISGGEHAQLHVIVLCGS